MKLEDVQKALKEGKAEFPQKPEPQPQPKAEIDDFAKFMTILELLRRPKYHVTTAPDFTPKSFLEQIQFYDDEAGTPVRRIYFYVNGSWSYVTLT